MKLPSFFRKYLKRGIFCRETLRRETAEAIAAPPSQEFFPDLSQGKKFNAPERLRVGGPFFTQDMYLRQGHRADWQQTDARTRFFAAKFIEEMRVRYSIPIYAHNAFRTREEQDDLVARRVSRTSWPTSAHNQGKAVDLVHSRYHWDGMRPDDWAFLGKVGLDIAQRYDLPITWGGSWKSFPDPAHWEITNYRSEGLRKLYSVDPQRIMPRALLRNTGRPLPARSS